MQKTRNVLRFTLPVVVFLLVTAVIKPEPGLAQNGLLPVASDDNGITGFSLHYNGLLYWRDRDCQGPAPTAVSKPAAEELETIRTLGPSLADIHYVVANPDCDHLSYDTNVVRDGTYVYFVHGQQKQNYRKAVYASIGTPPHPFCPTSIACSGVSPNSLYLEDGFLYWSVFIDSTNTNIVYGAPVDGSQEPAAILTASNGQTEPVRKLQRVTYATANGPRTVFLGIVSDNLYKYMLPGRADNGSAELLVADGTDYAVHHSQYDTLPGLVLTNVYVAKGERMLPPDFTPAQNTSALLEINLATGNTSINYEPDGLEQVLAVTTDSDRTGLHTSGVRNVYIAEYNVTYCDPTLQNCFVSDPALKRHSLPAADDDQWVQFLITTDQGSPAGPLHSDDEWVYFLYRTGQSATEPAYEIRKISTDAPPVELDVKSLGLEVVQTIQNMDNDAPLIAGKETYARGYAYLAKNTTGQPEWLPMAHLHGYLDGQELPDSPLTPINNTVLNSQSDLEQMRKGTSDQGNYLFRLPQSWTEPAGLLGSLTLEMRVDPYGALPETGSTADNNASLPKPATVQRRNPVCLDLARIWTDPLISQQPPHMADILARAQSLLPVSGFKLFYTAEIIRKPVVEFEVECDFYFPGGFACPVVPKVVDYPFDFNDANKDDDGLALFWLTMNDAFTDLPSDCQDDHYLGMVHPAVPNFNGIAYLDWPNDLVVRMEPDGVPGQPAWNAPWGGRTLAHELGHNYARPHIDQTMGPVDCGDVPPEDPGVYPYDPCTIGPIDDPNGYFGFDVLNRQAIHPAFAADVMSYANSRWISDFTWYGVQDDMVAYKSDAAGETKTQEPVLLVSGVVTPSNASAQFLSVHDLPAGVAPAQRVARWRTAAAQPTQQDKASAYSIRLLDGQGNELASEPLLLLQSSHGQGQSQPFVQYVPAPAQTERIQLLDGDTVMAEQAASSHMPVLKLGQPLVDEETQTVQSAWTAYDEDNAGLDRFTDMLLFTVLYSADNGATWQTIKSHFTENSIVLDANSLPGGQQARLRVLVSDGFNTAVATTPPFTIPHHAPQPIISGILNGQHLEAGKTVQVTGLALDADQGSLPDGQLTWALAGPVAHEATGDSLVLSLTEPGAYSLTLAATDDAGLTGQAGVSFTVRPLAITDAATPTLDGFCSDAGYGDTTPLRLETAEGQIRAWLLHADGALFACFADLHLSTSNTKMKVGLRLDVDNSGEAIAQPGDVGFRVDESGLPAQFEGDGTGMSQTLTPQPGYTAVVQKVNGTWSAEMRLEEALLGGWNHAARLMLEVGQPENLGYADSAWPTGAGGGKPATWAPVYLGQPPALPNQAPVADAGPDVSVHVPEATTVNLNGDASYDVDGDALTYQWTQIAGPAVALADADTMNPTFTVDATARPVELSFQLVVNDGQADSAADQVVVTLVPSPPSPTPDFGTRLFLPLVMKQ